MSDELASQVPPVILYCTEFDYYLDGVKEATELYRKNQRLLDFAILKGLHHGAHHRWDSISRGKIWFQDFGRICKTYLGSYVLDFGVPEIEYFRAYGRASPIEMLLAYKGISYTTRYITAEEWHTLKSDTKNYPHGHLPVINTQG